jgi:formate C-acetyltransferase
MATVPKSNGARSESAWRGFTGGAWQTRVNLRDFIQRNYTPYEGDGSFLQGPTERTKGMWQKLQPLLAKEREKGILDVSQVPSSITAHAAGYIDKANEIIVGLQTEAPLKRAIMPFGGWRVVAASLESYGYKPEPALGEIFSKYRKTHNDGVFDAYTPRSARRAPRASSRACRTPMGAAASSATTDGWRSMVWTSSSRTRNARSASWTTGTRPKRSSACARSSPSSCAR